MYAGIASIAAGTYTNSLLYVMSQRRTLFPVNRCSLHLQSLGL